jgi:peptidase S41-like protein/tricorn protease-like protein
MRPWTGVAMVVVLATALIGCSSPARNGGLDGVWRTDGYGWIIQVQDGHAQTFETTSTSCLPAQSTDQLGQPAPDGTVQFARNGVAVQTLRRTAVAGQGELRLLGTAADIDLVSLPALPEMCSRPTPDDPLTNFDIFWTTFKENYNSTARKNIDWDAVRDQYRPMVTADTTSRQLYQIFVDMIKPLGDAHAVIEGPDDHSYSPKRPGTRDERDVSRRDATRAVDDHLRQDMGVTEIQNFANGRISYADLPGGRGYLRITSFDNYGGTHNKFVDNSAVLRDALNAIFTPDRVSSWRGLIIDAGFNTGGDDELALQVASRLTNTSYLAYSKQARNDPNDPTKFGRLRPVTVTPFDGPRYTGPVRLLISDLTVSAGETFTEAMLARNPAPSLVGLPTQGVFSDDMQRHLPNGWTFTLGNEDYYAANGHNYEGLGIPPTIQTPVFTPAELAQHSDTALDTPW